METTHKKFRVIKWYDKKKKKLFYGIDIFLPDHLSWYHLADDLKPMFFDDRNEANRVKRGLIKNTKD